MTGMVGKGLKAGASLALMPQEPAVVANKDTCVKGQP